MRRPVLCLLAAVCVLQPRIAAAQRLTGTLIGTVKDAQGGVLPGALVRVSSPALIGGQATLTTNEKGQLRFPALPPGAYALDIEFEGFATYHEEDIRIGVGATIERTAVLRLAGLAESVVVEGAGTGDSRFRPSHARHLTKATFTQGVEEVIDARIYSGIHYRTSDEDGERLGHKIARFVMEHTLRSRKNPAQD